MERQEDAATPSVETERISLRARVVGVIGYVATSISRVHFHSRAVYGRPGEGPISSDEIEVREAAASQDDQK